MVSDLLTTFVLIVLGIGVYRFRGPILSALLRFDQNNRARHEQQLRDRADASAHFRHTLELAEEQVETVSELIVADPKTGQPVTRFLFEGEQFLNRDEAEQTRWDKIRGLARDYYRELPKALAARRDGKLGRD